MAPAAQRVPGFRMADQVAANGFHGLGGTPSRLGSGGPDTKTKLPTPGQAAPLRKCRLGISFGPESLLYSFPSENPMNARRLSEFSRSLRMLTEGAASGSIGIVQPVQAREDELLVFHTREFVDQVKRISTTGEGSLNDADTPAFKGIYEASLYPVGNTLNGLRLLCRGSFDHFFNPVGGLHHSAPDGARGFCVFNDSVIAISKAINEFKLRSVAYVDIDAHHGDGVFYEFEAEPRVIVGDIHEDGRFLYPGTGRESEAGTGFAAGTKMNIPLLPGSGDQQFFDAFDKVEELVRRAEPEMIFFQCGADGLVGDPITDLRYSSAAHSYAAKKLHQLAHEVCEGKLLAMGGGGYNPTNVSAAWTAVIKELAGG